MLLILNVSKASPLQRARSDINNNKLNLKCKQMSALKKRDFHCQNILQACHPFHGTNVRNAVQGAVGAGVVGYWGWGVTSAWCWEPNFTTMLDWNMGGEAVK